MQIQLSGAEKRKLRGQAQKLETTFKVGKSGLSEAFILSVRKGLEHQPLLKVKFVEFKEDRKTLAPQLAEKTESQMITMVGNVVVLYKPKAE